jgi:alkaline phosphatase D
MRLPRDATENRIGYPIYEVTSSSLNEPSGNFTGTGVRFINEINPFRVGLNYAETNFGLITIDWSKPSAVVRLQVRDQKGNVVLQQKIFLDDLKQVEGVPPK